MKKIRLVLIIFSFILFVSGFKVKASSTQLTTRTNIDTNKEWTVKFNSELNESTVTSDNLKVTDSSGNVIPVYVKLGADRKTVIVSPQVSGYAPDAKYTLTVGNEFKSVTGKSLAKSVQMEFDTINKYSDGTDYMNLPKVTSCDFEYTPLLSNEKQVFTIGTSYSGSVEYRIFVHSYSDSQDVYTELTNGYTETQDGKITSLKTLKSNDNGQKYKAIIYVRRNGQDGAHNDVNTDYDNYYVDYFRCIDSVDNGEDSYTSYDSTLSQLVDTQYNQNPVFVEAYDLNNKASKNQIKYYMDPNNFLDSYGKYQFMRLSYVDSSVTADSLNNILKGKGILEGKGQVFLDAAKESNINVAYLISQSLLETGNGQSVLANGGKRDTDGNYIFGSPAYNFFSIGAFDSDSDYYGTKMAYDNKWFTPDEAIKGGAEWIASSYINNTQTKQDTLYKMRWNPLNSGTHQYATDISWAYKQISDMIKGLKAIFEQAPDIKIIFDIPQFK